MRKYFFVFVASLFVVACRSEAKMGLSSPESHNSGKLTPADGSEHQLKMGMQILFSKLSDVEGEKISKAMEAQITLFEPCLQHKNKAEVIRLTAVFGLNKSGRIKDIEVLEVLPESASFKACFIKYIEQLDIGQQSQEVRGELTFGTYFGSGAAREKADKRSK